MSLEPKNELKTKPIIVRVASWGLELTDGRVVDTGTSILLSPKEAFDLMHDITDKLFEWHELTGRKIDDPKCF